MTMSLSDFDTLMEGRYSCRAFRPDPVPRVVIERIVDAARKTPSWCNAQPWQVVITSGEETDALRTALREEAKKGVHSSLSLGLFRCLSGPPPHMWLGTL